MLFVLYFILFLAAFVPILLLFCEFVYGTCRYHTFVCSLLFVFLLFIFCLFFVFSFCCLLLMVVDICCFSMLQWGGSLSFSLSLSCLTFTCTCFCSCSFDGLLFFCFVFFFNSKLFCIDTAKFLHFNVRHHHSTSATLQFHSSSYSTTLAPSGKVHTVSPLSSFT